LGSSKRARALYVALETDLTNDEYTLGRLPDGRWALVGLPVKGHRFAVEVADLGWGIAGGGCQG
jgi:hypothetical protein